MTKQRAKSGKRGAPPAPQPSGVLADTARAIGSTLGTLAGKAKTIRPRATRLLEAATALAPALGGKKAKAAKPKARRRS